jgi:hypothetical protein
MDRSTSNTYTTIANRSQLLGRACLAGGMLFAGLNSLEDLGLAQSPPGLLLVIGVVLLLCLMGGPLGLLASSAAGSGRTGRTGIIGAIISLMGLLFYLVGVLYTGLVDPEMGIFYALGALLSGVGMLLLGIAVLLAKRLEGWRRFTPLLVGAYYVLMIPIQIVFFIGPHGRPSATLLALWGLTWALLGYAIYTHSRQGYMIVPLQEI